MMKTYWEYMRESMDKEKVEAITNIGIDCIKYKIYDYSLNDDMSLDIKGSLHAYDRGLSKLPFKLRTVDGDLLLSGNNLTNMDGFPSTVGGRFDVSNNKLTSMVGGPKRVGESYDIYGNDIRSFEGFPTQHPDSMYLSFENNPVFDVLKVVFDVDKSQHPDKYPKKPANPSKVKMDKLWLKTIEFCNEWDVIDEDNMEISYLRLCEVFNGLNLSAPPEDEISFEHYTLVD